MPHTEKWVGFDYDIFISAYNASERVKLVFDLVGARHKFWILHREYDFSPSEFPDQNVIAPTISRESGFIQNVFARIEAASSSKIEDSSICVDTTGFMRPHLLYMMMFLYKTGIKKFDVLYTEPLRYKKKEKTRFSDGDIITRQVEGFRGVNSTDPANDLLIIGAGYDHRLIKAVAEHKGKADKVQIFGLPSLKADMYQENVLAATKAADAIGTNRIFGNASFFAPANDPFVTASVLSEIVSKRLLSSPISNLYLSPLATKAQAVGFGLYYIKKCINSNASMIFPVSENYDRETSEGLSRIWRYTLEF